jgi:hypothetical protein
LVANAAHQKEFMTSTQRIAVLSLALGVFATLAFALQSTPDSQPPVVSQTTTTTVPDSNPPVPMTKSEMKAQRRRQKLEEKSASADAKAQKSAAKAQKNNADALKQQNKSTDATEKANNPQ